MSVLHRYEQPYGGGEILITVPDGAPAPLEVTYREATFRRWDAPWALVETSDDQGWPVPTTVSPSGVVRVLPLAPPEYMPPVGGDAA